MVSDSPTIRNFSPQHATRLFASGAFDRLSEYFLTILESANSVTWVAKQEELVGSISEFLQTFFSVFVDRSYVVPPAYAARFIDCNPIIMNLAAISAPRTTDRWLTRLLDQSDNLLKVLTLLNARCTLRIDIRALFDVQASLASLWYIRYFHAAFGASASPQAWSNLRAHMETVSAKFQWVGPATTDHWFLCTYVMPEKELPVKMQIHKAAEAAMQSVSVRNRARQSCIAVVSSRWQPASAVYRTLAPYLGSLEGRYELALVQTGGTDSPAESDERVFSRVLRADIRSGQDWLREIADNDFALAWFPDLGMEVSGKLLAELRIAPIQVMGYGHPVSTFGSKIDYVIGGQEVELPDRACENYSERLVLIPGLGVWPVIPDWTRLALAPRGPQSPFIMNCPWSAPKINASHLQTLRRIVDSAHRPVRFRFFPSHCAHNGFLPLCDDIAAVLGDEHVEVIHERPPSEYLAVLAEGDATLDSWPFGGFNTVMDSLAVGRPIVTLEGKRAFNRFAAAALRRIDLGDLVAAHEKEYVTLAVRMIDDTEWREAIAPRYLATDWRAALRQEAELHAFRRAIDFLIENHKRLRVDSSREPIWIS